ncbi:diguanylate cyclase [Terasakiella sp. SH-1]|uniref:diguanylate cyclase n=1 Tax=Terasakiella sp. SH-1 TaxID=2560057 RepID=UPI001073AC2B|nr:diguanylate cyclase [Terasakiella sp. SH-1]
MKTSTRPKVLIVEDTQFFRETLKKQIEEKLGFSVITAQSYADACGIILEEGLNIYLALLDLNLPDAPNGEIVDFAIEQKIPSVVVSGYFNENIREELAHKNIIDYVIKKGPGSIDDAVNAVKRIYKNQLVKILVVDDSLTARVQLAHLLRGYRFQLFEAADGPEALTVLQEHPDIKLTIVDYNMPKMDGCELVEEIRQNFSRQQMAIIGISGQGSSLLSTKFIKLGANDFLNKPFMKEEIYCRVTQNLEMLDHIKMLEDALITDYLTGLKNRRYLFDRGEIIHHEAKASQGQFVCAMLDIDHFKKVNDEKGHGAGDVVLVNFAGVLQKHFRNDAVVARFGGDEFCIVMLTDDIAAAKDRFEVLRADIAQREIEHYAGMISVTSSVGICTQKTDTLEEAITLADEQLYKSKVEGRNKVSVI